MKNFKFISVSLVDWSWLVHFMCLSGIQQISLTYFTAPPLVAPPHHCPHPPHSIVRSWRPTLQPPLLFHQHLKPQFSATGPDPLLHRCLPPQFIRILPILQHTAHTQHHQSIGPRCVGRLLIFSAVPLRRCGLQSPDAGLPALLSITLNSQTPPLPDPPLSLSFPVRLSTVAPLTFPGPSLLLPQAFL